MQLKWRNVYAEQMFESITAKLGGRPLACHLLRFLLLWESKSHWIKGGRRGDKESAITTVSRRRLSRSNVTVEIKKICAPVRIEYNGRCRANADVKNPITRWVIRTQKPPVVLCALTQFPHSMAHFTAFSRAMNEVQQQGKMIRARWWWSYSQWIPRLIVAPTAGNS